MKKYIQETNTLRLTICWNQFADVDPVILAFNVLQNKKLEKSPYITKAIKHFDETKNDSRELTEAMFSMRCISFLQGYYQLSSKKSVRELLSLGTESATFQNASERMLKAEEPRTSLLGFRKSDPEAAAMHERLFQMAVRERILLIATAIEKYVMDGMDSSALMACSYKMLHDVMIEYERSDNKTAVVNSFYELMQQSKGFKDTH